MSLKVKAQQKSIIFNFDVDKVFGFLDALGKVEQTRFTSRYK